MTKFTEHVQKEFMNNITEQHNETEFCCSKQHAHGTVADLGGEGVLKVPWNHLFVRMPKFSYILI